MTDNFSFSRDGSGDGRLDSFAFEGHLADLMSRPPLFVSGDTPLRKAAQMMAERRIGAVLVGAADRPPEGILTERDMLRIAAMATLDMDRATVAEVMSSPVATMTGNEMLYRALGRMDRLGIRHLCVVDAADLAVGMLSQRDLLVHRARDAVMLGDAIESAADVDALTAAYGAVPSVMTRLLAEGLDGAQAARVVSSELQALTERAALIAVHQLEAEGMGPAPAPWCVFVLGSGGRGESLLGADQDNALIHEGTPDDDPWFAALGAKMADMLDAAGLPRCKGGVMVTTPQWRGTVEQWRGRVEAWVRNSRPQDLLDIDIFFDLVPVAGNNLLAERLHTEAVALAAKSPTFIALLANETFGLSPRFTMFGRLPAEMGRVDLKRDGLLPLVSLARTMALRVGSTARTTPGRLLDAARAGRMSDGDAEALAALHRELLTVMLGQQLDDLGQKVAASSRVDLKRLERKRHSRLIKALRHLDDVVGGIRAAASQ